MSSEPLIIRFLRRAVVQDQGTWFNICHKFKLGEGRSPIFPGSAHKSLRTAMDDAMYWARVQTTDVYLAQGAFLEAGETKKSKYPAAIRQVTNLAGCKNLYMDVDVKPTGYATQEEAARAVIHVVRQAKLPAPTLIVGSGSGGIHVYWTLNEIFDQKIFRQMASSLTVAALAHNLKFDQGCTNDPVHLFRIAGTWNFKGLGVGELGRPVTLLYDSGSDIPLADMQAALAPFVTQRSHHSQSATPSGGQAFVVPGNEDLGAGLEYPKANIDTVAQDCPFLADTLATGGRDLNGEPQWHDVVALSCHCDDPSATIHRLCSGNQFYDHADTEEKLAAALRAREQRPDLGPPKCEHLHNNGAQQCAACPHLSLGTTPLSVPFKKLNGHAYAAVPTPNPDHPDLPGPYYRDADGLIRKLSPHIPEGDPVAFEYQIIPHSGFVEAGETYKFHFTTFQGEQYFPKILDMTVVSNQTRLVDALSGIGLPITQDRKMATEFVSSYTKLIQSKRNGLIEKPSFGWAVNEVGQFGFSYAGKYVSPSGALRCKQPAPAFAEYTMVGDSARWRELADIVLTPDRPDLCVMAATAFGAPLVRVTGEKGVLMGVWSAQSGIGKSTSLMVGQAIWGPPTLSGLNDTQNYTFGKAAELRHLPLYYDEIKSEKQILAFCEIVMQLTGGHEKGRSDRFGKPRPTLQFETSVDYAANKSMVAAVRDFDRGTDASWLRMFEMQGIVNPNNDDAFIGAISSNLAQLQFNYGGIGQAYAAFLGQNHTAVVEQHSRVQDWFTKKLNPSREQRFWMAAVTTTMLGAKLANELGFCQFPLHAMTAFLTSEFDRMRVEMARASGNYMNDDTLVATLGAFINDMLARRTVILDRTCAARGRPKGQFAMVLNEAPQKQWDAIAISISETPAQLRFSDPEFGRWCAINKHQKSAIVHALKEKTGARLGVNVLASGSDRSTPKINSWTVNTAGTILADTIDGIIETTRGQH